MYSLMALSINAIEIVFFVVIGLALAALITITILFSVSNVREEKHNKEIKELSNSLRILVIDVANDKVRYFNSAHLRERKTSSITSFYNQFFELLELR